MHLAGGPARAQDASQPKPPANLETVNAEVRDVQEDILLLRIITALKMTDAKKMQDALHMAANFIVQLETSQPDMGGEVSKKLFEELLHKEPLLKKKYEALKKGAP